MRFIGEMLGGMAVHATVNPSRSSSMVRMMSDASGAPSERRSAYTRQSEAVRSAAVEAASSSARGSGWALSGPASSWECRAAQSRQVRPEEAQEPSLGTAKGGL